MLKRLVILVVILMLGGLDSVAQSPATATRQGVVAAPASSVDDIRRQTFEKVWTTVRDRHFDPTYGGVDWEAVRRRYAPQIDSVKSDSELYTLLQRMLGELRQSHFNIIPPDRVVEDPDGEDAGGVGLTLRVIEGRAVITRVEPNSPAAEARLKPGYAVAKIDNTLVDDLVRRFGNGGGSLARLRVTRAVSSRVEGEPGTRVRLTVLGADDAERPVELVRRRIPGEMAPPFGHFPAQRTEFEAKRLPGGFGYIRFNIWVVPQMEKIRAALGSMKDAPGLIIDLRGNPGGIGGMSSGLAGMLETRRTSLGTMKLRAGQINFAVFPQKDAFAGPVAILIDGLSASTSEIFAAGMQETGRAVVVGERSAGAALPSVFEKLPTGALFQYAIGDFKSPRGTLIEGRGVVPDIEVGPSRGELLRGLDPQLEAAVAEINRRRG